MESKNGGFIKDVVGGANYLKESRGVTSGTQKSVEKYKIYTVEKN